MLTVRDGFLGFRLLARVHGSAAYKAFIPSLVSTGILLILHYVVDLPNSVDDRWFGHPYPLASVVVAFTFLLTFKCSFSYNRYWEACTAVHQMHSKWLDVGIELAAFHMQSKKFDEIKPPSFGDHPSIVSVVRNRKRINRMSPDTIREISHKHLMKDTPDTQLWSRSFRAVSSDGKKDHKKSTNKKRKTVGASVNNLIPLPSGLTHGNSSTPQTASINNASPNSQMARTISLPAKDRRMEDDPSLFLQEGAHLISLLSAVAFSTLRGDIEGVDIPLTSYIPGSPWPAMDPDADAHVTYRDNSFYRSSRQTQSIRFLFGMSRNEEQQTIYNACREFGVLGGTSAEESNLLRSARGPLAKTALCSFWLQEFIAREFEHGALGKVAPPIVSRLFQYTSDGMIGYNQARKVAYVPFPFPHAQLTSLYILVMMCFLPILMLSYIEVVVVAAILNTLSVTVFVGLHEVAKELEEPFRNAPNDLPLNNFQAQFNEALIAMYAGYHPESWWSVADNSIQETEEL